jgi:hypothetical protein
MQFDPTELDPGTDLARLLAAIPAGQQARARAAVLNPKCGGRGLRAWLGLIAAEPRPLPASLPAELVEVYLKDAEAEPLFDCEACGLPVPVRAGRRTGHEPTADRVYFPACPLCGGRTGPHAYWANAATARAAVN